MSGLTVGKTYAVSFGYYQYSGTNDLAISGGTILYQSIDVSGGANNALFGIAIIKATSTTITQTQSPRMVWGTKAYEY